MAKRKYRCLGCLFRRRRVGANARGDEVVHQKRGLKTYFRVSELIFLEEQLARPIFI